MTDDDTTFTIGSAGNNTSIMLPKAQKPIFFATPVFVPYWFASLWVTLWLFTIGICQLNFTQGVVGLILWPFYLGVHFGR